jgi:uncharacterized membrane-anchored protein YhcB (DUF1043 family)
MVAKKAVKKTVMKRASKLITLTLDEQVSLAERLEESEAKLELSIRALMFARDAMKHMAELNSELLTDYQKAVKHIAKLEKKLEK